MQLLNEGDIRSQHLKYRSTLQRSSLPQLEDLLPAYVNLSNPVRPVTRLNSVCGPGVGALLAHLIWTLCDEGDGALLSTVSYPWYLADISHTTTTMLEISDTPQRPRSSLPKYRPPWILSTRRLFHTFETGSLQQQRKASPSDVSSCAILTTLSLDATLSRQ